MVFIFLPSSNREVIPQTHPKYAVNAVRPAFFARVCEKESIASEVIQQYRVFNILVRIDPAHITYPQNDIAEKSFINWKIIACEPVNAPLFSDEIGSVESKIACPAVLFKGTIG